MKLLAAGQPQLVVLLKVGHISFTCWQQQNYCEIALTKGCYFVTSGTSRGSKELTKVGSVLCFDFVQKKEQTM